MVKKKLFRQIYIPSVLLTSLVLFALAVYSSSKFREFYYEQVVHELDSQAQLLTSQVKDYLNKKQFNELDKFCKEQGKLTGTRITVVLLDGTVVAESNRDARSMSNHSDRVEIRQAFEEGFGQANRTSGTERVHTSYVARKVSYGDGESAVLRTSVTMYSIEKVFDEIYVKILLGAILAIITLGLLSIIIIRKITHPIADICQVAKNFAAGSLENRAPNCDIDEINDLSNIMNDMATQLDSRIKAITQQRNETETIFASMSEGLLAIDSERRLININKSAADIFGIDAKQVLKNDIGFIIRKTELIDFIEQTFGSDTKTETEITVPGQTDRHLLLHGAKYQVKNDENGVIIVIADITKLKRLENIRKEFVANVSHELKTPITAIRGFVETLQDGAISEPGQADKFLGIISRQTDRMHALIEDLLSLSRLEDNTSAGEITFNKISLFELFNEVVETQSSRANDKEINFVINCREDFEVTANKALLTQAVANLVDNAVKYSPEKSSIEISAQQVNNKAEISVKDTGCGIPSDHHERLFERFYVVDKSRSRKLGGTGLGLAIVKHITRTHKGNVSIDSSPGKGSTFTISLPN